SFGIYLLWKRKLHKDAVDFVTAIQVGDQFEKFCCRSILMWGVLLAVKTNFFGAFDLPTNVNLRRRIVTDQYDCKTGPVAGGSHCRYFGCYFSTDFSSDFCTVKDCGRHLNRRKIVYEIRSELIQRLEGRRS